MKPARVIAGLAVLAAAILGGALLGGAFEASAQSLSGPGYIAVDIGDITGNSKTSHGAINDCVVLPNVGDTTTVDIVVDAVPVFDQYPDPNDPQGGIAGFGFDVLYNNAVVRITARAPLETTSLISAIGYQPVSYSDPLPDADGDMKLSEADSSLFYESGAGVVIRFTFEAVGIGSSYVLADDTFGGDRDGVPDIYAANASEYSVGGILNGRIVVGDGSCADPPPPTPTISPSPSPRITSAFTPTPGPTPAPIPSVDVRIDAGNLTGNTPTSHGTVDTCVVIPNVGGTAVIDIVVDGIPPAIPGQPYSQLGTVGFALDLIYNPNIVMVVGKAPIVSTSLIASTGYYGQGSQSNTIPDSDGDFKLAEFDTSPYYESGSGVLVRLTLQARAIGASGLLLSDTYAGNGDGFPDIYTADSAVYGHGAIGSATIIVGPGSCYATPTPSPTPSPTPAPTPIPTPSATVTNALAPGECGGMTFDTVITGTAANDTIIGTQGRDLIIGLGGNDYISGQNGNDCIVGGDGNDTLVGDGNDDVIVGGSGDEYVAGGAGNDKIWAGPGNDTMQGQAGTDSCDGGPGTDSQYTCEVVAGVP